MIEYINIPEERMKLLVKEKGWKEKLNDFLGVSIDVKEEITIEGEDTLQIIRAKEIIKAFGRGFGFDESLNLLDEDYVLDMVNIKEFTSNSKDRQTTLKGRVIGKGGRTKKAIEKFADVKIAIYGKTISIIGKWENARIAKKAIEIILSGSKHNTVYRFLEEHKVV